MEGAGRKKEIELDEEENAGKEQTKCMGERRTEEEKESR